MTLYRCSGGHLSYYTNSIPNSNFIGTTKLSNGIVYGFSSENNFIVPLNNVGETLKFDFRESFEINLKFSITNSKNKAMTLFGAEQGFYYAPSIEIADNNSAIWCGFSTNGSSWDNYLNFTSEVLGGTVPLNTDIVVNAVWNREDYTYTVNVTFNDNTYTLSAHTSTYHYYSQTYNLEIGGINRSNNHFAQYIQLDLTKSYIKSNGVDVWGDPGQ